MAIRRQLGVPSVQDLQQAAPFSAQHDAHLSPQHSLHFPSLQHSAQGFFAAQHAPVDAQEGSRASSGSAARAMIVFI